MAFKVEDGTGLPDSNSYLSVEAADSYFTDSGNSAWLSLTVDAKQSALVQATRYMDARFSRRWRGQPLKPNGEQALAFPRVDIAPNIPDGMPKQLLNATAEYAVIGSAGPLAPAPQYDGTGRLYTKMYKRIGPIITEYDYDTQKGSAVVIWRPYPIADAILSPLLQSAGAVIRN